MAEWNDAKYKEDLLARADDGYYGEVVTMSAIMINIPYKDDMITIFEVSYYNEMDGESNKYFGDIRSACSFFGKEARRKYLKPEGKFVYNPVEWTDEWKYYRRDLAPNRYDGGPSSTGGDYGPSNPWDAPGMKVSDFIRGVY